MNEEKGIDTIMKNGIRTAYPLVCMVCLFILSCKSPTQPSTPSQHTPINWVPDLISPQEGAVLDNGRKDKQDYIKWDFDWSDVQDAIGYNLYVEHEGSSFPAINEVIWPIIAGSEYHHEEYGSYIADKNRFNWRWKVRTYHYEIINGDICGIYEDWSKWRYFDVEPVNTDPPTDG